METDIDSLKNNNTYRYIKELMHVYHECGIRKKVVEIPVNKVMAAPIPDYISFPEAVRIKVMFIISIYSTGNVLQAMFYTMPGFNNMMLMANKDIQEGK